MNGGVVKNMKSYQTEIEIGVFHRLEPYGYHG